MHPCHTTDFLLSAENRPKGTVMKPTSSIYGEIREDNDRKRRICFSGMKMKSGDENGGGSTEVLVCVMMII